MKNTKYIISIIALLLLNVVLIYKLKTYNRNYSINSTVIIEKSEKSKKEILTFEQNFINESINENLEFDNNVRIVDINNNDILAKDLFKNKSIVLYYSELHCNDCITAEINTIIKNKEKLDESFVLLAHYQNNRDLFVFNNEFQKKGLKKIKMYLLLDKGLNIPADKLNIPYYFCIDSTLRITNFFIPQKDKPKLSESYLINTSKNFMSYNN
ncbi:hypothetical protein [Jejuia pallidilutea]|uniref:AhpC/TSA family protein n=1 Tax=Jejuia pallidilutea TaxID=504487 RepID=A0A090W8S8_9FLAO|nr:hypothetical protein [Jejuia pallidilutea]GAL73410.1 hypothetical protein JCM19302_3370 [Jejuia pallidilutea]GAL89741.1 hypothetical protein JCM19538_1773 [Jejuia pallidilutea]